MSPEIIGKSPEEAINEEQNSIRQELAGLYRDMSEALEGPGRADYGETQSRIRQLEARLAELEKKN